MLMQFENYRYELRLENSVFVLLAFVTYSNIFLLLLIFGSAIEILKHNSDLITLKHVSSVNYLSKTLKTNKINGICVVLKSALQYWAVRVPGDRKDARNNVLR